MMERPRGQYRIANRHIALDLLRIVMSVFIIGNHTRSYEFLINICPIFYYLRRLAVPCFLILSAYFTSVGADSALSKSVLISRVKRLYTPILIWSMFSFLFWASIVFLSKSADISQYRNILTVPNVGLQLLFGHVVDEPLYYLVDLLWLNFFFYSIFSLIISKKNPALIIVLLIIVSYMFQYSGVNFRMFHNVDYRMRYTLGRFIEFVPLFSIGILARKYAAKLFILCPKWRFLIIGFLFIGYVLFSHDPIKKVSFGYSGLGILLGSISIFLLFAGINIKGNGRHVKIINALSEITLGVYCVHFIVTSLCYFGFKYFGLTSHQYYPLLFLTTVGLSFLIAYLLKLMLGKYSQNVIT